MKILNLALIFKIFHNVIDKLNFMALRIKR